MRTSAKPAAEPKARAPKPRKLKVYQSQIGFYETVVAAPNRTAALRAWGTHRDLFADGEAREATDDEAIASALAQPETPLRRGIGTNDAFGLNPGRPHLPDLPDKPKAPPPAKPAPSKAASPKPQPKPPAPPKPPPDRSALDAAQAALKALDADWRHERDAFDARRTALDREEAAATRRHEAARKTLEEKHARAERAYVAAGGRADRGR